MDARGTPNEDNDVRELTGTVTTGPADLLRAEVLAPQLQWETTALLPWYIRLEKVLLAEYLRMGLLTPAETSAIDAQLDAVTPEAVSAAAGKSMDDIVFTLERLVMSGLEHVPATWHVDRSRNDLQASAQLLHGRDRLSGVAELLLELGEEAHRLACRSTDLVMPGYTHMQPAQVMSPGFYFAGLCEAITHSLGRLHAVHRTATALPLGAGAMTGQELPWDRGRMARLTGSGAVEEHALRAVAQRDWALEACAEFSLLGITLSRFTTDLMMWSGAGYGFVSLPDEWSGISSAMPQKRNYPVLERIRGRTAHLTAAYVDMATVQRNTPFTNSVEVSKEASAVVPGAFDAVESVLRLLRGVLADLRFDEGRMRQACETEYLGGFTLANLLTLRCHVPWRTAQVVAGCYIVEATARGLAPTEPEGSLLAALLAERGYPCATAGGLLREAMNVTAGLTVKRTEGSASPDSVRRLLTAQAQRFGRERAIWAGYQAAAAEGSAELDELLREIRR